MVMSPACLDTGTALLLQQEEIPMTMQVVVVATDGLVVVSDTESRLVEQGKAGPSVPAHISKISVSHKHKAAIAVAGWSDIEAPVGGLLARHLDTLSSLNDDEIEGVLESWANDYYKGTPFAESPTRGALFTLLIARPSNRFPILKVLVNKRSTVRAGKAGYMVGGYENHSAVFWLEYLRLHKEPHSIEESSAIAALTVLAAGEISPDDIGGLEIWQYRESWQELAPEQISDLIGRFDLLKRSIRRTIRPNSKRDRSALLPSRA